MDNEDKKLLVDTLAELRELRGEMREFKLNVIHRVERLEKKEAEQGKEKMAVVSILISAAALTISIIVNFFKHGGK